MLPAYTLLTAVFIELLLIGSLNSVPELFFISIVIAVFTAAAVFALAYFFKDLLDGQFIALFGTTLVFAVAGFVLWSMSDMIDDDYFLYYCLYPCISTSLLVLIKQVPKNPVNRSLLKQIIAFRNHLKQQCSILNNDLKWRLALNSDNHLFQHHWRYNDTLPGWLESTEVDAHKTIIALHSTFGACLRDAVCGDSKRSSMSKISVIRRGH